MKVRIQLRRDTAANWTAANPLLKQGEIGIELDTTTVSDGKTVYKFKIGNGTDKWNALNYAVFGSVTGSGGTVTWTDIQGKPTTFPPSSHVHPMNQITGLSDALNSKANTTDVATELALKADSDAVDSALALKANTDSVNSALALKADTDDVNTALALKANASDVTTSLASKADLVDGKVPTSQIPAIAITEFLGIVSSQSAMLALSGQKGDWCKRSDLSNQTFIITGDTPSNISSWTALDVPTAPVSSVNGQTGNVVLGKTDIGLGNVDNTSDTNKPVSSAQQTALDAKVPYSGATTDVDLSSVNVNVKALGVKGVGGNGHVSLKHQSADATSAGSETAIWADSNGNISIKNDGNPIARFVMNAITAARSWTFQDRNGTLADLTDIQGAKDYADSLVVGLLDDRGNFNASGNTFPTSGGSGTSGTIKKGDLWTISVGGMLGGVAVTAGDVLRALVDTPGQTSSNWVITENNLGYVAENADNKATTMTGNTASNTKYLSAKAIYDWVVGLFADPSNITQNSSYRFVSDTEKATWNAKQNALTRYISTTDGTAISSTTTIGITSSQLIPANTLVAGNVLRIIARFIKSTAVANTSFYIYVNTSNSLTGATQLAIVTANTRFNGLKRDLFVKSASATQLYSSTTSAATDDATQSNAPSSINIDWTQNQYIIFAVGHSGATDTGGLTSGFTIEKF